MKKIYLIILLLGNLAYAETEVVNGAGFVTVGSTASGCDFSNITTALNNLGGATEVRIVSNTYDENLVLFSGISMRGGFTSCANANANISDNHLRATIQGLVSSDNPVIWINGSISSPRDFVFENLVIENGYSDLEPGGGLYASHVNGSLTIKNVSIQNNSSAVGGGGLAIINQSSSFHTQVDIENSSFYSNDALAGFSGGGIYCVTSGAGTSLNMNISNYSSVRFNHAIASGALGGNGGGIYSNGCVINFYSGSSSIPAVWGIDSNTADNNGGGIYATGGSYISLNGNQCIGATCNGDPDSLPVSLTQNTANVGGAVYLGGTDTYMEILDGWIYNNTANVQGGAIALFDKSYLFVRRSNKECWNEERCNFFSANRTQGGSGGAIYTESSNVASSVNVQISNAFFEDNRAATGTAISARTPDGVTPGHVAGVQIDNSVFNHNGNNGNGGYLDNYVISALFGAVIKVYESTFADNNAEIAVFQIHSANGSQLKMQNSIVHDSSSGTVINSTFQGSTDVRCLIAHEIASFVTPPLNPSGTFDPQFVNPASRDYHIAATSPVRDLCDASDLLFGKDMDFENRGWDDPTISGDPYDVGADETYASDIIFEDGFE